MALLADDGRDRAEQLLLLSERLSALIAEETKRISARQPALTGPDAEEKNRLANAYRLELSRVKQDPGLLKGAPQPLLTALRRKTLELQQTLNGHEIALGAIKAISEGLVQSMAEEVNRQRGGASNYGARGNLAPKTGPRPALIDRTA